MEETPITCRVKQQPLKYKSLSKRIVLSPKSAVAINAPGFFLEYHTETVTLHFGIGKDHVGWLVMEKSAWEALKADEPIDITTIQEFKETIK